MSTWTSPACLPGAPVGYLCGGPRRTRAAPRSPRSPKATGVPLRLEFRSPARRCSEPPPAPALRWGTATRSRALLVPRAQARPPRPRRSGGAAGFAHRYAPLTREASPPGPARFQETSTLRPGCQHPEAVPVGVRAPLLLAREIKGLVFRQSCFPLLSLPLLSF